MQNIAKARPSEVIRFQENLIREQNALIDLLKAALAAAHISIDSVRGPWLSDLTPQERALIGSLYACYPRAMDRYDLLETLPGYDRVKDRQVQVLHVVVHRIRRKFGDDAIITERGLGFRLGEALRARLAASAAEAARPADPQRGSDLAEGRSFA